MDASRAPNAPSVGRAVRRLLAVALLALSAVGLGALPALAADDGSFLRLAHLSPDTPAVDVYVAAVADPRNSIVVLPGVVYGAVSPYNTLPAGQYVVSMRPAGADPSTQPVISTTVEAQPGKAYTVAGVGAFADLGLRVLDDDLTLPPEGQARARVVQAAAGRGALDITVSGGTTIGSNVDFATTTPYQNVTAGTWTLQVAAGPDPLAELPLTVESGSVYSVLVLNAPGQTSSGLALAVTLDASGSQVVPDGGVETGLGGLAAPSGTNRIPAMAMIALGALCLLASGLGLRPRVRRTDPAPTT